MKTTVHL